MDNETIAKLGFEAGADSVGFFTLKKFAELVAAHEREACAKLADDLYASARADEISDAIRARK
jgi:hypothetical protein